MKFKGSVIIVTVSHAVQDILDKQILLQEALGQGIISYNKLANYIKPDLERIFEEKPKKSAIIMAIRRYSEKMDTKNHKINFNYFKEILLKTNMCYIMLDESSQALNKVQDIYNKIELNHGRIFNIVHANYEIGIITNQNIKEKILDGLYDEKINRIVDDLVVISLTYTRDYLFTPGVIYNIVRLLAWEKVNILSIFLTFKELNIVISRSDAVKTYNLLEKLMKTSKT